MNVYQSDFIANLIYYREQKGYTQATLAAVSNCSKGNIGGIEAGKSLPSFETILKIAYALEIHPADLFLRNTSKNHAEVYDFFETKFFPTLQNMIDTQFRK
ncbi:helix-turn-helix domain-containing protein [Treponema sp.]|uniref:helix-turn-helix domain-containing protein n=1 Tax=Treponema sp. TaxID=166 RepID=UPI003890A129